MFPYTKDYWEKDHPGNRHARMSVQVAKNVLAVFQRIDPMTGKPLYEERHFRIFNRPRFTRIKFVHLRYREKKCMKMCIGGKTANAVQKYGADGLSEWRKCAEMLGDAHEEYDEPLEDIVYPCAWPVIVTNSNSRKW